MRVFVPPFATGDGVSCVVLQAGDDLPALPASERALTGPMVPSRMREFAWGREAARRALAGIGIAPVPLLPDADRVPVWPPGVTGSISHSGRICGAAIRRGAGSLGFDIETGKGLAQDLWEEVLTGHELERLWRLPAPDRPAAALAHFTAKEAVFKAHFPVYRQMFGFMDAEITAIDATRFVATFLGRNGNMWATVTGRWHRDDSCMASGVLMTSSRQEG